MNSDKPSAPFDFGQAVTMPFQTSGGSAFAKRLWFWTAVPLAISLLIAVPLMAPHYGPLLEWYGEYLNGVMFGEIPDGSDIRAIGALLMKMLPGYLVMMVGMWASAVIGEAALHRKALLDTEAPGRPVQLGADEGRVVGAQLCVWGLLFLIYTVGVFVAVALMGVLGAALGPVGAAFGAFSFLAIGYFVISFAVRLMPASALSVKNGRLTVMQARAITKGKFWPLFGAFVVMFIGGSIVVNVVQSFGALVVFGSANPAADVLTEGGDMAAMMENAAQRVKNPLVIFGGVICVLAYSAAVSLWYLCLSGIGTYAVKWAQGEGVETTFD